MNLTINFVSQKVETFLLDYQKLCGAFTPEDFRSMLKIRAIHEAGPQALSLFDALIEDLKDYYTNI